MPLARGRGLVFRRTRIPAPPGSLQVRFWIRDNEKKKRPVRPLSEDFSNQANQSIRNGTRTICVSVPVSGNNASRLAISLFCRSDSFVRANRSASTAIRALVRVDGVDVTGTDSANGAFIDARAASYAAVRNFVSHCFRVFKVLRI